jgi:hypothetical protein
MKKFLAIAAFVAFISVKSASAQTEAAKSDPAKPNTEAKAEQKEMKSCHGASAASSCCKNKKAEASSHSKKASCCAKHEEKAEAKDEKAKGSRD